MEKFKLTKTHRTSQGLNIIRPLLPLAFFVYVATSDFLKLSDKAPFFIGGALLWLAYEIYRTVQREKFEVILDKDFIQVGSVRKEWDEIENYEFKGGMGMMPAVILFCTDGSKVEIPVVTENLEYVRNYIQNALKDENRQQLPKNSPTSSSQPLTKVEAKKAQTSAQTASEDSPLYNMVQYALLACLLFCMVYAFMDLVIWKN